VCVLNGLELRPEAVPRPDGPEGDIRRFSTTFPRRWAWGPHSDVVCERVRSNDKNGVLNENLAQVRAELHRRVWMMRIIDFDGDVGLIPTAPEQLLAVAQAEHERQQPGYRSSYDKYVDEELRPLVADIHRLLRDRQHQHDILAEATEEVAARLSGYDRKILEKDVECEYARVLSRLCRQPVSQRKLALTGWNPIPGSFDLAVGPLDWAPLLLGEIKWSAANKIFEVMWDLPKVIAGLAQSRRAGYLLYGFPTSLWTKPAQCAEVFTSGVVNFIDVVRRNEEWWERYILPGGTARPLALPNMVDVTPVANARLRLDGVEWSLRVIAVEPAPAQWTDLHGGHLPPP
jgi:hypothetical protein